MRNPLSAIMQCADGISSAAEKFLPSCQGNEEITGLMEAMHENARTILLCTSFQRRIIDDILTVSKLDSTLLTITPVLVEPWMVMQDIMQMFDAEMSASDIVSTYNVEASCDSTWAHCDPSRLTQILVNLITNAIKFTKRAAKREIHVTLGTSKTAPPPSMNNLKWYPSDKMKTRIAEQSCGSDETFLTFKVRDTGKGMSDEEMSRVFERFGQASPMTHVNVRYLPLLTSQPDLD